MGNERMRCLEKITNVSRHSKTGTPSGKTNSPSYPEVSHTVDDLAIPETFRKLIAIGKLRWRIERDREELL